MKLVSLRRSFFLGYRRCPVAKAAMRYPHTIALEQGSTQVSYQKLHQWVSSIEGVLRQYEGEMGDHVGLWMEPSLEGIVFILALNRLGRVTCVLNKDLPPAGLDNAIQEARLQCLIAPKKWIKDTIDPKINTLSLEGLLSLKEPVFRRSLCRLKVHVPMHLVRTSGSTGHAKWAALSYENFYQHVRMQSSVISLGHRDAWLLSLPWFHVSGLAIVYRTLIKGATLVLPHSKHRGVTGLVEDLLGYKGRITHVSLVEAQLHDLNERGALNLLRSLKAVLVGGGPLQESTWQFSRYYPLYPTYGLTEHTSQVATYSRNRDDPLGYLRPLDSKHLVVKDGEICIKKGRALFLGYMTPQGSMNLPLDEDGLYHTGDLGELTPKGLRVAGRKDESFTSGGETIQPEEIEVTLLRITGIKQAVVIGRNHAKWGKVPIAFLDAEAFFKNNMKKEDLQSYLRNTLEAYKIPKAFYVLPQSGHTSKETGQELGMMKVDRHHLRTLVEENNLQPFWKPKATRLTSKVTTR